MERTESIGSIDTIYRNDSIDIVEYNPQPNPDTVLNPVLRDFLKYDVERSIHLVDENKNQITRILLNEKAKKSSKPFCYFCVIPAVSFAVGFFIAVIVIVTLYIIL